MNYYAQGGQAHGLKALAKELPKYGRHGDSIVAHINPEEAGILKALGGSGTINPTTGLPEFFKIGNIFRPVQQAVAAVNPFNPGSALNKGINQIPIVGDINKAANNLGTQIFQPLEKTFVQPASRGLASFDKAVGNAIPGGWGTVAQVAASMIPGAQPLAIGLGAANGSGVMRKGGSFNLQGAMIGGATAYATSELGEYLRAAGGAPDAAMLPVSEGVVPVSATAAEMTADEIARNSANQMTNALASESANVLRSVPQPTSFMNNVLSGNISDAAGQLGTKFTEGASQFGTDLMNAPSDIYKAGVSAKDAALNYDYSGALKNAGQGMSDTASGIKSVLTGNINPAAAAAVKSGATMAPMMSTVGTAYGIMNLADQEAQLNYLKQQKAAGNIAQAEYDAAVSEINRQRDYAAEVVRQNPFSTNPSRDVSIGDTYYGRTGENENLYSRSNSTLYKEGGEVKHYLAGSLVSADGTSTPKMDFMALQQYMQNSPVQANQTLYEQPMSSDISMPIMDANVSNPNLAKTIYDKSVSPVVTSNLPTGIIAPPPNSATTQGFSSFYNPVTGEEVTVPTGGYTATPESGFFAGSNPRLGSTLYRKNRLDERLYAMGGSVDDEYGMDEARDLGLGNLSNGFMNMGSTPTFAAGGQPRFLSGGGDGMSDSIKASINGDQEARLADGEFVVPADVVSHLGNGSSKAGAKQLYSMMDKVRQARVGTKKQGKQINPRKYLAA
jgi:hypothetical protein